MYDATIECVRGTVWRAMYNSLTILRVVHILEGNQPLYYGLDSTGCSGPKSVKKLPPSKWIMCTVVASYYELVQLLICCSSDEINLTVKAARD